MRRFVKKSAWIMPFILLTACQSVSHSNDQPATAASQPIEMNEHTEQFSLPSIPPAKLYQHPMPEMRRLDNGMDVWYVYNPMVPLMTMRVVFDTGTSLDPIDKSGLSTMTAAMLKEGSAGKTAQAVSDEIENLGAVISPRVNRDISMISAQVMTQYFEKTVDLLADVWLKPDFRQESFDRLKKIVISRLQQRPDSPEALAKLAANRVYFGETHPYGRSSDGYISTIGAITLDDVKSCYRNMFDPSRAAIIAVGDMETDALVSLLNRKFGAIERKAAAELPALPEVPAPQKRVVIVDKPDAPQTIIRIYQPAVPLPSLKTLSWQFVNIPFGESFTSRLMQNIREDKGYSYGANSAVLPMMHAGILLSTSAVAREVTGAALKEFLYELERLPKGNFEQDEFERARETWKASFVQSCEVQDGVLATVSGLYMNHKPVDAINAFAREIDGYTLDKFNETAREFPTVDQAAIVLVGDKKSILEQISELDLPEPIFCGSEGEILK